MALILKNSPVGVDKSIDTIQNALYTELVTNGTWTNYESYHRAYRNETKNGIKPEVFTGNGNDYADVYMDDKFTVTSFFLVSDETVISEDMFTSDISVIFQVNLNKLYTTAPHRFDEEFRNEIVKVFKDLDGTFSFNSATTSIDGVYSGLDTEQVRLNDTHPCHVVRFELEATYTHACDNVFATTSLCTLGVSVSTTDETAGGANDGTATANIVGAVGGITYLWDDPLAQTTQTAVGLAPNTYTVTVTDDVELGCVKQASGEVEAAPVTNPDDLDNLVIWIRPDVQTLFNGGSISDTDPISDADSQAPGTVDFEELTVADQTTWHAASGGDLEYIRYDKTQGTRLKSTYAQGAGFTTIDVIEFVTIAANDNIWDNEGGGGNNYRLFMDSNGSVMLSTGVSQIIIPAADRLTAGQKAVVTCVINASGTDSKIKINNETYGVGNLDTKAINNFNYGSKANDPNSENGNYKQFEGVAYSEVKTDTEIEDVVAGLMSKHGIT